MAKFRSIQTSFWSDSKIIDDFTPEDRYFYLYLLTNEKSNQLGCYELSIKQMCRDTGYNEETIKKLLDRFENILKVINFDYDTKEILLKNWYKYNWLNSEKTKVCIEKELNLVKSLKLKDLIYPLYAPYMPLPSNKKKKNNKKNNKNKKNNNNNNKTLLSGKSVNGLSQTSELVQNCNSIVSYLNKMTGANYRATAESTKRLLKPLFDDYSVDDIILVIDKMCYLWGKEPKRGEKDMRVYLRPSTLFRRSNFENYLGMNVPQKKLTTTDLAKTLDFSEFR